MEICIIYSIIEFRAGLASRTFWISSCPPPPSPPQKGSEDSNFCSPCQLMQIYSWSQNACCLW